jgi:hypothetical protein
VILCLSAVLSLFYCDGVQDMFRKTPCNFVAAVMKFGFTSVEKKVKSR